MFIVGFDLEKGVAFTGRGNWLIDQGFERYESSQDHFEQGIIDPTLPVIVVLFHNG
jgi:hypothetical protein